jgi:cytochrome c biogenesis protein CcdA/glutaredoxin
MLIESPGCHKCAAAERAINQIASERGDVELVEVEYFTDEGHNLSKKYKAKDIPAIIVGNRTINYRDYEEDDDKLKLLIRNALDNESSVPDNDSSNQSASEEITSGQLQRLSLGTMITVFSAGLLAGFNPCLLGILVFLASMVLSGSGRKRDLIVMISVFSLGIFTMYFLFGLGMQQFIHTGYMEEIFRYILTALLVILGLSQLEDARRLSKGKNSIFRTDWALKYIEAGASRGKLSSYFLVGALFSLVKVPCIGAVYLAILDMISSQGYRGEGAVYLFMYNLGIILPIVILGGFMALGLSPEQVDRFRKDHRSQIRLATGLTLIALAPLIYWKVI